MTKQSQSSAKSPARDRSLAPLISVTVGAAVAAVLLAAVAARWRPLESADHDTAARLNSLVSGHPVLVTLIRSITMAGNTPTLVGVLALATLFLAIRREWRLSLFLIASAAGGFILDPVLKNLVGRLRPVVAHPIAHGLGNSFPSGHALNSTVCYGALLLVFLPAARGNWRKAFKLIIFSLVVLIGISRIVLGVHFVSDVLGGWAIGIAWLGITTTAFELTRQAAGRPVTAPMEQGLEPEEQSELTPAVPEPPASRPGGLAGAGRVIAGLVVAWVLILGVIIGAGELVVRFGGKNLLDDTTIPAWFAAHRTPTETDVSTIFTRIGSTQYILMVAVAVGIVVLAITRRWRPIAFLAAVMVGEIGVFLIAAYVVMRPRPFVPHLDGHAPPTSSYPSGHTAATACLYVAIAILAIGLAKGWWRWLFLIPAIGLPLLVAVSRMYRGEHHPTDVLGSLLLCGLWLTVTTRLIRPGAVPAPQPAASSARPGAKPRPRLRRLTGERST
ncbi:MAG TPA: phosphatase PAP2 family protein [Streptosporangiaceae bacterium]|nr:phosphatase PAP2 family protein [Streptosporangiaceae bacterium]